MSYYYKKAFGGIDCYITKINKFYRVSFLFVSLSNKDFSLFSIAMNKNVITEPMIAVTRHINSAFGSKEPWQIATISATAALTLVWLWNFINQDESEFTQAL